MKTLTIDGTDYKVEEEVAELIMLISEEKDQLTKTVFSIMAQTLGWTHTDNCLDLDKGVNIQKKTIPEMLDRAKLDLGF